MTKRPRFDPLTVSNQCDFYKGDDAMTENEPTKICSKCQETKQLSEFSKRTGVPDGLQYSCKECANAIVSEQMKRMKPCPFCGEMPAITEHAPKIYGRYQWQIGCVVLIQQCTSLIRRKRLSNAGITAQRRN